MKLHPIVIKIFKTKAGRAKSAILKCHHCKILFRRDFCVFKLSGGGNYCSRSCFRKQHSIRMTGAKNPFYKKHHPPKLLKQISENISKTMKGKRPANSLNWKMENHPQWQKKPTYSAIHQRIHKMWGNPPSCEECGNKGKYILRKNGTKIWTIHWSNKSGKYIWNDRNDWWGLCTFGCHLKYDNVHEKSRLTWAKKRLTSQ